MGLLHEKPNEISCAGLGAGIITILRDRLYLKRIEHYGFHHKQTALAAKRFVSTLRDSIAMTPVNMGFDGVEQSSQGWLFRVWVSYEQASEYQTMMRERGYEIGKVESLSKCQSSNSFKPIRDGAVTIGHPMCRCVVGDYGPKPDEYLGVCVVSVVGRGAVPCSPAVCASDSTHPEFLNLRHITSFNRHSNQVTMSDGRVFTLTEPEMQRVFKAMDELRAE